MSQRPNAFVKGLFHCNLLYMHSLNSQDSWFPRPARGRPRDSGDGIGLEGSFLYWQHLEHVC